MALCVVCVDVVGGLFIKGGSRSTLQELSSKWQLVPAPDLSRAVLLPVKHARKQRVKV